MAGLLPYVLDGRLLLPALVLQLLGVIGLVQPLRSHSRLCAALLTNVGLLALYFWSLDEAHNLVLRVSRSTVAVTIDGNAGVLRGSHLFGTIEILSSPYAWYHIQATGEPPQLDTFSVTGRLAQRLRLAGPGTAWADVQVDGRQILPAGSSGFAKNTRNEWEAPPASTLLFPAQDRPYTLTAHLLRPDGTQTILLGLHRGNAYALQLRFDQPDILWVRWTTAGPSAPVDGVAWSQQSIVSTLQRNVRLLLLNYVWCLLLSAVVIGLYPILVVIVPTASRTPRIFAMPAAAPYVVGACALGATALVATELLDRMPHVQDSVAYLFQATNLASGRVWAPAPPASIQPFFQEEFIPFFQGKWFAQYPPGHPLVLALGVLVGAPWLVGPVLASASLTLIALSGGRMYGKWTGLLAAALGLTSPFWLFLGSSFMSHPTGLFLFSAVLLGFVRVEDGRRWAVLLGLAAGWLFITRELTAVALLVPFGVFVLVRKRHALPVYLPALPAFALPIAFLGLYNWLLMGNPLVSTYAAWNAGTAVGFGQRVPGWGTFTPADGLWDTSLNLQMLEAHLFGWPWGLALAFLAVPFVVGRANDWDYLLVAVVAMLVGAYVLYPGSGLMYGPRYFYEALPPLLLLTARGLHTLVHLPLAVWSRFGLRRDSTVAALPVAGLLLALLLFNARFYLPAQIPLYRNYNFSSPAELQAVAAHHIHHAIVFVRTDPSWYWWEYGNVFFANDPALHGDVIYARDLGNRNRLLDRYLPGRTHYRLNYTSLERIP